MRAVTDLCVQSLIYACSHVAPVYTVDKAGFKDMITSIEPQYQLPHKDYFSRIAIPALYEDTRQNVLSTLKNEANYYCRSLVHEYSEPYLSFTIHYVDKLGFANSLFASTVYAGRSHWWVGKNSGPGDRGPDSSYPSQYSILVLGFRGFSFSGIYACVFFKKLFSTKIRN